MKLLKMDIDFHPPDSWLQLWAATRGNILEELGVAIDHISFFNTKRGLHVYIKLSKNLDDKTANMLQFLLGDDHTRVKINQWRIKRGIKRWNKLFHKVLYRRKPKVLECYYCGNVIPVPDRWFENNGKKKQPQAEI